jgi:lipoprotein-releasing system ATP-binding protein
MNSPILELVDVKKEFDGAVVTEVLHGIDLRVNHGEFVALVGPSGSGKSTLLNILGLLDRPTSGVVMIQGQDTVAMDDCGRTRLRGRTLGFVFQFHHLLGALTAVENVMMPLAIESGSTSRSQLQRARDALDAVGLLHRADARAGSLSGGEQQRAAVARALVHEPPLILADEPTGNLDSKSSDRVLALMRSIHAQKGTAFLIVTHDPRLAENCDRIVTLVDGRIESDVARS